MLSVVGNNVLRRTLFLPPYVRHCSQTLHQALLAYTKLAESTADPWWCKRARYLAGLCRTSQQPDGGFDIGYEFNFGSVHNKGEPTTPEMLMAVALKVFRKSPCSEADQTRENLEHAITAAESWIENHAVREPDGSVWIPYSPISDSAQVVNNALSFAIGALSADLDPRFTAIYEGLIKSARRALLTDPDTGDEVFYYYAEAKRTELPPELRDKIDYYHIAQQLEMHAMAEAVAPQAEQRQIIEGLERTLVGLIPESGFFPIFRNVPTAGRIHVWGLASIIPGLVASHAITGNDEAIAKARSVYSLLMEHSFRKNYFVPVLSNDGSKWDYSYYVRSDAWCLHALASILPHLEGEEHGRCLEALERVSRRAEKCDYSSRENHAMNRRLTLLASVIAKLRS